MFIVNLYMVLIIHIYNKIDTMVRDLERQISLINRQDFEVVLNNIIVNYCLS